MSKSRSGGYRDIAEYYEHLIRTSVLKPGTILPTEIELAKKHDVTRTTIRRAFAGLVQKGLVTKRQGRGTQVAPAADVESRAHSHVVIAMPQTQPEICVGGAYFRAQRCHDALYLYVESLVTAISDFGRPFRLLYFTEDSGGIEALLAAARQGACMGLVIVDVHRPQTVDRLAGSHVPVVFLDSNTAGRAVDLVRSDNVGGAREATRHLLRTTSGPLAFLGNPAIRDEGNPHKERLDGFLEAHREAGREVSEGLICGGEVDVRFAAIDRMLALPAPPAGYVCSDDNMAVDALDRLHERGVVVPAQASIFGFGNLLSGLGAIPALSTVMVDRRTMGRRAVELLHSRLDNPSAPPTTVTVPVVLRPRMSTVVAAPPAP